MTTSTISAPTTNQLEAFLEDDLRVQSELPNDMIVVGTISNPLLQEAFGDAANTRGKCQGVFSTSRVFYDLMEEEIKGVVWSTKHSRHIAPRSHKALIEHFTRFQIELRLQEGRCQKLF